jgi:hypothetical protein
MPSQFPDSKRFAFTILDDTDVATVANVRPIYDLLHSLGMRATKTVWPVRCPEGSENFSGSQTLEDEEYRTFVIDLRRRGFEITWHGATMESSPRERTVAALELFRETFGMYPRIHANHAHNRENVYWGSGRLDDPILRRAFGRFGGSPGSQFVGHIPGSPYWWGDLCERHITYARNLTFGEINTSAINPSMPYRDPVRPLARWWFSATDAEGVSEFNDLLHPRNLERLEAEGGVCIVATHLGKGYVRDGVVNPVTRQRLESLAERPGWFPTVGELLDRLRSQRRSGEVPAGEWRRMQWRWARDLVVRRLDPRRNQRRRENGEGR